jgi:hypothetical protein
MFSAVFPHKEHIDEATMRFVGFWKDASEENIAAGLQDRIYSSISHGGFVAVDLGYPGVKFLRVHDLGMAMDGFKSLMPPFDATIFTVSCDVFCLFFTNPPPFGGLNIHKSHLF